MKKVEYNEEKRRLLLISRGIDLKEISIKILNNEVLASNENPNYPNQKKIDVIVDDYVCCVPVVEDNEKIFIKTARPDRKRNALYTKKKKND